MDLSRKKDFTSEEWQTKIEEAADACAERHFLDKKRVRKIFNILDQMHWVTPEFPQDTVFDTAIVYLNPEKALRLFESSNLDKLMARFGTYNLLTNELLGAFNTLDELTDLTSKLIEFQEKYSSHIIKTGFPLQRFNDSYWFDSMLARLCYVKAPVNFPFYITPWGSYQVLYSFPSNSDKFNEPNMYSLWVKPYPENTEDSEDWQTKINLEKFKNFFYLSHYNFSDNKFYLKNGKLIGEFCSYDKAPCFNLISDEIADRMDDLREKLFLTRQEIFHRLLIALETRDATTLWKDCLFILKRLKDNLGIILDFENQLDRIPDSPQQDRCESLIHPYRMISKFHGNSGLKDLMWVIGHYEKEICLRSLHDTKLQMNTINYMNDPNIFSKMEDLEMDHEFKFRMVNPRLKFFFQIVTSEAADNFNRIIDNHQSRMASDFKFIDDFNNRIKGVYEGKFKVKTIFEDEIDIEDEKIFLDLLAIQSRNIKEKHLPDVKKGLSSDLISEIEKITEALRSTHPKPLTKPQEKDYENYGYKCKDQVEIPGTTYEDRQVLVINGNVIKAELSHFIIFLQLVVALKRNMNGWLHSQDYSKMGRVRREFEQCLIDGDPMKFIENQKGKGYRISVHPDFINYDKNRLLTHSDNRVRELAEKLPD